MTTNTSEAHLKKMRKEKTDGLLSFHAFTGANTSSRFAGKTTKVLPTLGNLGGIVVLSSTETDAALENLIFLYGPKVQIV